MIFVTLPYNGAIPHQDIYPRKMKTCPTKDLHKNVHSSIIRIHQKLEAIQMSIS